MLWSPLGPFWKGLIQIKELKSLLRISVVIKRLGAHEFQGSVFGYKFWSKNAKNLIQAIIESSHEHLNTWKI